MNLTVQLPVNTEFDIAEQDQPHDSPVPSKLCFSTRVSSGNSKLSASKLHETTRKIKYQQGSREKNKPKDRMDDVEVIMSDKGIDFWEERTQGLRVWTPCDVLVDY
jgi:hypothetical protein